MKTQKVVVVSVVVVTVIRPHRNTTYVDGDAAYCYSLTDRVAWSVGVNPAEAPKPIERCHLG